MPRELSAPFQAIGYASLFYGFWPQLSRFKLVLAIACVGRMALTNYLLQTLICTTLFYHLGLFMHFDRLELLAFVIPVWLANILFSVIWLRYAQSSCHCRAMAGRLMVTPIATSTKPVRR